MDVATQLPPGAVEIVITIHPIGNRRKSTDFNDLAGKLQWQGDALAVQREMRDEW